MKFKYIKSKINQLEGLKQYGDIDYENSKLLDELKLALSICSSCKTFKEAQYRPSPDIDKWMIEHGYKICD
jgi:hypothetical protein